VPGSIIVVSGMPGSGKTTVARELAPALNLPLFDKDDILEGLFESRGIGDAVWREKLSRDSDEELIRLVRDSNGAVVSSFWRRPATPSTRRSLLPVRCAHGAIQVHLSPKASRSPR
jgi:MoxR-like ATPase